jgi:hypothetical protein
VAVETLSSERISGWVGIEAIQRWERWTAGEKKVAKSVSEDDDDDDSDVR